MPPVRQMGLRVSGSPRAALGTGDTKNAELPEAPMALAASMGATPHQETPHAPHPTLPGRPVALGPRAGHGPGRRPRRPSRSRLRQVRQHDVAGLFGRGLPGRPDRLRARLRHGRSRARRAHRGALHLPHRLHFETVHRGHDRSPAPARRAVPGRHRPQVAARAAGLRQGVRQGPHAAPAHPPHERLPRLPGAHDAFPADPAPTTTRTPRCWR